jgi:intracellular protein transport protein USO1
MLLDCLESSDFYSRLYALQLLSNLLKARAVLVQKCLLLSPLGISRLVASLNDNREAVRNGIHIHSASANPETLLDLIGLTDGNSEIQKLVAFENAFEILFAIIEQEGGVDGGIVVQDCMQLLTNLLRYNSSNQVCHLDVILRQNYFRETRGVQRLVGVLPSGDNAGHWPPQRVNNTILSLAVTRMLISRGGTGTKNNQVIFKYFKN